METFIHKHNLFMGPSVIENLKEHKDTVFIHFCRKVTAAPGVLLTVKWSYLLCYSNLLLLQVCLDAWDTNGSVHNSGHASCKLYHRGKNVFLSSYIEFTVSEVHKLE